MTTRAQRYVGYAFDALRRAEDATEPGVDGVVKATERTADAAIATAWANLGALAWACPDLFDALEEE